MERVVSLLVTQKGKVVPSWLLALSPVPARLEPGTTSAQQVVCQHRDHSRRLTHTCQVLCPACWGLGLTHFPWAAEWLPSPPSRHSGPEGLPPPSAVLLRALQMLWGPSPDSFTWFPRSLLSPLTPAATKRFPFLLPTLSWPLCSNLLGEVLPPRRSSLLPRGP